VQRFRGELVFKAHRLVYHSNLGLRVIKKKKKKESGHGVQVKQLETFELFPFRSAAVGPVT